MKTSDLITLFGVVGTWIVAALAVWGEGLTSVFFRPKLRIELLGLSIPVKQNNEKTARYYRLKVTNARRTRQSAAHDVRLLITRVEEPDAGGDPRRVFDEMLPLLWERQEVLPLTHTVGADAHAPLFFVREDGVFEFTPVVKPNHFKASYQGRTLLWVTLCATSNERDSPSLRVKIEWDGQWQFGEAEMKAHVKVSIDPPTPAR
jgi:hypothetical protein